MLTNKSSTADVDVVILTSPPHFRPQHLAAAVAAGKHCFVEKPIAVDVPGVQRVRKTCELAAERKLAVVSGLCWRYDAGVLETMNRIADGAIGDIIAIESPYNTGTLWHRGDKPEWSRMEYQIRNWLYYTWLSGDHIVEQAVHSLDKTAWLNERCQSRPGRRPGWATAANGPEIRQHLRPLFRDLRVSLGRQGLLHLPPAKKLCEHGR